MKSGSMDVSKASWLALGLSMTVVGATTTALAQAPAAAPAAAEAPYAPPTKRITPGEGAAKFVSNADTPRRPDGKVDLTGVWTGNPSWGAPQHDLRHPGMLESDQMLPQRASQWNKPHYKPEFWQKVRDLDFSRIDVDPSYNCSPNGVPRAGPPIRIIQTDKDVVMLYNDFIRVVPTDGRERDPTDSDQSTFYGLPLGHWEGDTLVVESIGFNDRTWLQFIGYFHTDLMKVTERFTRKGNALYYNWTVDDPDVLAEPWTTDMTVKILNPDPKFRMNEPSECDPLPGIPEVDPYNRG